MPVNWFFLNISAYCLYWYKREWFLFVLLSRDPSKVDIIDIMFAGSE